MANVYDYLSWRGDLSFKQDNFNEVDGLILAKLAYIPYEYFPVSLENNSAQIKDIAAEMLSNSHIVQDILWKDDVKMLEYLIDAERFRNLRISNYKKLTDTKSQTQFSAITVELDKDLFFISYRGTDDTLVGWKEDLNMSFTCPVPGQELARKYFEEISSLHKGKYILGGHSKGGNQAIYASLFCPSEVRKNIIQIFNFDGPGFYDKILQMPEYKEICDRIKTFVPQSSIVGMLLSHEEKYIIVHSTQRNGIMQHDMSTWEIQRTKFEYLEAVDNTSKFINFTVKDWLTSMEPKQREIFVDTIYKILLETNAKTVTELNENWLKTALIVLKSVKSLDEPTKKAVNSTLNSLKTSTKKWFIKYNSKNKLTNNLK